MASAPMPKMRAGSLLQTGKKPRNTGQSIDPEEAICKVPMVRTLISDRAGAVPSEAYLYDLVFEHFAADEAFRKNWKVCGFERCSTEESISQKNSYIRVVMDLDTAHHESKLYPTAYTPGFPTIPRDISDAELQRLSSMSGNHQIPGLPEGYSVALDVYIRKDAEILLKHQRAFRGRIDAAYQWLDKIVNKGKTAEELQSGELGLLQVSPMDNNVMQALGDDLHAQPTARTWTWQSTHHGNAESMNGGYGGDQLALPATSDGSGRNLNPKAMLSMHETLQPAARETLPLSCLNACPRGLGRDAGLDAAGHRMQEFRREIHTENALINAFGGHVGLPQRDTNTSWGTATDDGAAKKKAYDEETDQLDRALQKLWSRTVETSEFVQDDEAYRTASI